MLFISINLVLSQIKVSCDIRSLSCLVSLTLFQKGSTLNYSEKIVRGKFLFHVKFASSLMPDINPVD